VTWQHNVLMHPFLPPFFSLQLEKSVLLSSDTTSKALQVVEKIELDTEKIRENIAQTNVQLDKFEQQLVTQMEQLKKVWETEQKEKQVVDASLLQSKKTLEDNANGLNLVNQTLETLTSTIFDEFKKLASRLEPPKQEPAAVTAPVVVPVVVSPASREQELHKKLEASLGENAKLVSKKKYQLGQILKVAEDLEGILELATVERTAEMSKFDTIERKFVSICNEIRSLKALTRDTGLTAQQLTKELGEANTQIVVLREKRTQLLTLSQSAHSLILYLLQSFVAQAKIVQKTPSIPSVPAPAIVTQKLTIPTTTSLLDVQEKLDRLIQVTETHAPALMVYLEDQIDGYSSSHHS